MQIKNRGTQIKHKGTHLAQALFQVRGEAAGHDWSLAVCARDEVTCHLRVRLPKYVHAVFLAPLLEHMRTVAVLIH